jgi:hypothetical protein
MKLRLPMTRRRACLAAAMFAAAAVALAVVVLVDSPSAGLLGSCIVVMAALPAAGASVMLGRSWIDASAVLAVATVVGAAMFLASVS